MERIAPGLGPEFLQHVGQGISELRYLNRFDQLKDALEKLPMPVCFKHGAKITGRLVDKRQQAKAKKPPRPEIDAPPGPDVRDWDFRAGQYWCRGQWHPLPSVTKMGILKALVEADGPVSWRDLCGHLKGSPTPDCDGRMEQRTPVCTRVHVAISQIRKRLREQLSLPDGWDAVPCTQRGGTGGSWTIWLPEVNRKTRNAS